MTTSFLDAAGTAGRTVVARLKPKTDLVGGFAEVCKKNDINCGVILGGLGTLERAVFRTAVRKPETRARVGYSDPITVEGPIEFICGQGIIMEKEGDLFVHFHGVFMDMDMKVHAGHFNPGGNPVLSTIDFVVVETEGVTAERTMDDELGLELMLPRRSGR